MCLLSRLAWPRLWSILHSKIKTVVMPTTPNDFFPLVLSLYFYHRQQKGFTFVIKIFIWFLQQETFWIDRIILLISSETIYSFFSAIAMQSIYLGKRLGARFELCTQVCKLKQKWQGRKLIVVLLREITPINTQYGKIEHIGINSSHKRDKATMGYIMLHKPINLTLRVWHHFVVEKRQRN